MQRALELSLKGNPSPNPYVGAVLVRDGVIVSEGYHSRAGMPHAEVEVIRGRDCRGATLYVTLEPCSHFGRTPPCTKAIIEAGVSEVVYAAEDPTGKVRGREELEAAGVTVRGGVLREAAERVNEVFFKYSRTGIPFVVLKCAMTLDGQIATSTGESRWITGEAARNHVHWLRSRYDSVLVGAGTVLSDNPRLTARVDGGRNPLRVILDGRLRIQPDAAVFADGNVVVATTGGKNLSKVKTIEEKATVWVFNGDRVDVTELVRRLGGMGITSVLVEGGAEVYTEFVEAGLVDKFIVFVAPKLMGGVNTPILKGKAIKSLKEAVGLMFWDVRLVGEDVLVEAYPTRQTMTPKSI
mgnify:CR=1 FL=1